MDTDAGSDANNGTTWALAKLTLEGLLAVMSAGDRGWVQGAAVDTGTSRTLTSPGTLGTPCIITGVVDGTTAEPPTLSDLAITLPEIRATSGTFALKGHTTYITMFINSTSGFIDHGPGLTLINSKYRNSSLIFVPNGLTTFINTEVEVTGSAASLFSRGSFEMYGGTYIFTSAANIVNAGGEGVYTLNGVDLSGLTSAIMGGATVLGTLRLSNCKMPATFTVWTSPPTNKQTWCEIISSSDTSSQAATSSIQDFQYEDANGTIAAEFTVVRTGGADDGASGAFSYAMTARASATLESSGDTIKSPWMSVWIEAGSQTLTIFIANSSASTDYNEDEVWVEFYTPDSADTAQHEQNFDPGNARLFESSTAITDDTGSTWGTGGNNHQKLSVAVTPGFEGPAYARLHLAKRQATPDTLYLDPLIVIT